MHATRSIQAGLLIVVVLGVGLVASPGHAATPGGISGKVTGPLGAPVAGALVCAFDGWGERWSASTATDGSYVISGLDPGPYKVEYDAASQGFVRSYYNSLFATFDYWWAASVTVTDGAVTPNINAGLYPGGSIAGTVTSADGGPIGGAELCVHRGGQPFIFNVPCEHADETGAFEVPGLLFGTYEVNVRQPGFSWETYTDVQVEARVVTTLDPVLTPDPDPGSISGTVTLEGVPVEGLDVCAYRQTDLSAEGYCPTPSVATDRDGRYQMTGLDAGEYWVRFDGDLSNYDTEWFDDAQTDLEATTITITDGDAFTGIDADLSNPFPDRALPDELVTALDLPTSSLVSATTNAHPDSLALGAAPMGSLPTSGSSYLIMSTGRADEVLGGTPSERLSTDLEPSPHGVILAGGDLPSGDLTQVTLRTRPPSDAACLAFDLQFLSEIDHAIAPDIFTAELHRSHIRAAWLDVAAPNNFAVDDRAAIVSWLTPGFGPVTGTRMNGGTGTLRTTTPVELDADSDLMTVVLSVQDVEGPNGDSAVLVDNMRWLTESCEPGATEAGVQISGKVTDAVGESVEGAWVLAYRDTDGFAPSAIVLTDEAGFYRFRDLPPGTYRIGFAPVGRPDLLGEWYDSVPTRGAANPLVVTESTGTLGPFTRVDASLVRSAQVSGVVTGPSGAPAAGVRVSLYLPEDGLYAHRWTTTAADGTYRFPGLPAGTYKIAFRPPPASGLRSEWFDDVATRDAASAISLGSGASAVANAQLAVP